MIRKYVDVGFLCCNAVWTVISAFLKDTELSIPRETIRVCMKLIPSVSETVSDTSIHP
jgi:hypothetical protein